MFGEAWAKHQKSILSTSNCTAFGLSIVTPGFGAVSDDGYGLAYVIAPDFIDACVTNWHDDPGTGGAGFGGVAQEVEAGHAFDTSSARFAEELATALHDIQVLLKGS